MIFLSLARVIKFAFHNFFRNFWLSAATISVLVLTLVSINMLVVMNVLGKIARSQVESRIDVSVHFRPEIQEERAQTVKVALLAMPEVKDVEYVSPQESLDQFSAEHKEDAEVLASLGEVGSNPFGATLVVKAHSIDDYQKILNALQDPVYGMLIEATDFDDRRTMIDRIGTLSRRIEMFVVAVSAVFLFVALLIIYNTIRVSIYTHREEIGIMRLVGASNGFIRGPFYVEAVIWSAIAVVLVMGLIYPLLSLSQPLLARFFDTSTVDLIGFYWTNAPAIIGGQFGAVVLMSLVTTKIATAKYLKV